MLDKIDFLIYENNNIILHKGDYEDAFKKTDVVITDYSSVFIDKFINGSKVFFIQLNDLEFYKGHTSNKLDNYKKYGPVHNNVDDLIIDIIKNTEHTIYSTFRKYNYNSFSESCYNITKEILENINK